MRYALAVICGAAIGFLVGLASGLMTRADGAPQLVIDWAVLGTWAAVILALGIALKDVFQRWRTERFERKAVAEMLRAELDRLGVAASDLQRVAERYVGPVDIDTILRHDVRNLPREIEPFLLRLSAPAWDTLVSKAPILGADVAAKLVDAFARFALLRTMCEYTVHRVEGTDTDAESIRGFCGRAITAASVAATACRTVPGIGQR